MYVKQPILVTKKHCHNNKYIYFTRIALDITLRNIS